MAVEKFSKEVVIGILNKLIGEISPAADASIDADRLENVKLFVAVFDEMHSMIDDIAWRYKDDKRNSVKLITDVCRKQIESMGIKE